MLFVDDARDIFFADPADTFTPITELPTREESDAMLASDAEYAEWQARLEAEANAEFDAEMDKRYAAYCETEAAKVAMDSDKADKEVTRC
ncbi:hypothetical protein J5I95_19445 [Candidatus Poribacteria bacterium]|nr:hypothetical protein [Candidatus Poribacteria bacterium]